LFTVICAARLVLFKPYANRQLAQGYKDV